MLDVSARQLRAFLAVARVGNITRAAESLGLTPSPVGRAIRELEEVLKETLFLRDNRVTTMTAEAERILPFVVATISLLDGLIENAPRPLRVGVEPGVSSVATERLLAIIHDIAGVGAEHRLGAADELTRELQYGDVDLVLASGEVVAAGIESRPLRSEQANLSWHALNAQRIDLVEEVAQRMGGEAPEFSLRGEQPHDEAPHGAREGFGAVRPETQPGLDVTDVRVIVAISRHRNVRLAAESLGLTASPVGRTLREIETQLGAQLFTRDHHEVEPTQLMKELLPRAVEVLALVDAMASTPAPLRVGLSFWAPVRYRERLLAAGASLPPLEIVEANQNELLRCLVHGELDFIVLNAWAALLGAAQQRLGVLHFHVFSADEPVTRAPVATLADVGDRTVIALPRETAPHLYHNLVEVVGADRVHVSTVEELFTVDSRMRRTGAVMIASGAGDSALGHLLRRPGIVNVPLTDERMGAVNVDAAWRRLDLPHARHIEVAFRAMQREDRQIEML